jgi:hypothetical protein
LTPCLGPGPEAFGGQRIPLTFADAQIELLHEDGDLSWNARLYFAEAAEGVTEGALLGHEGFLDCFTAVFDGEQCILELIPNSHLPTIQ